MPKSRTPSSGKANRYGNEDYARRTLTTTIADPVSITGSSTRHDGMKSLGRPSPAAKATGRSHGTATHHRAAVFVPEKSGASQERDGGVAPSLTPRGQCADTSR